MKPQLQLNDKNIALLGAITLYGFSILGLGLLFVLAPNTSIYELIYTGEPLWLQLTKGILFGAASYLIIQFFLRKEHFPQLFDDVHLFAKQLNWVQIVFISIAAGVGEELLFRVAIQHFLGIWATAILFVFVHGYYSATNPMILAYGVLMTIISAGFGYMYYNYGIVSPMVAHCCIDLFILAFLKLYNPKPAQIEAQQKKHH